MANLNIRIDDNLKKQAQQLFKDIGLDMTTAITMFLQQAVTDSGIPFKIRKYNQETMDAYNEVEDMINNPDKYKGYDNLDDLWKDLGI